MYVVGGKVMNFMGCRKVRAEVEVEVTTDSTFDADDAWGSLQGGTA
jgi:hypothetical protein